jgi:hypothetical protein
MKVVRWRDNKQLPPLYPWEYNTGIILLAGIQSWSECVGREKNIRPGRESNPGLSIPQPSHYTD